MKTSLTVLLATAACFLLSSSDGLAQGKADSPAERVAELVASDNAFAFDLYERVAKDPKNANLVISPYSIDLALAMTYGGAAGDTAREMERALHFTMPQDDVHRAFASLLAREKKAVAPRGFELHVANSLWAQRGFDFHPAFLDLVGANYQAALEHVDFSGAPEKSRERINRWVEDKTRQKIKNLLQPGTIDSETRLVLANAVYLKGDWASPFSKDMTRDDVFQVSDEVKVPVRMMSQKHRFRYAEDGECQFVDLPIGTGGVSVLIALPKGGNDLAKLEKSLTADRLEKVRTKMTPTQMRLELPRFKIESEFDLASALAALGMTSAFDARKADFSRMSSKPLYVSAVVHKAFLDVHEEGIEAAAATAVVMRESSPQTNVSFCANHPFLYFVRDNASGSILFMGRLQNPKS